jgi:hypothetical protein
MFWYKERRTMRLGDINPAILLLAALCLAGWLLRDPAMRAAWMALGVAGMLLLAPALLIHDGIPSPAATLSRVPPWQGTADGSPGNPTLSDVMSQIQPWLVYLRHELRAGRPPFWNPHQFSGTPFLGNGQSAPFFPLHLLFVLLPLRVGFLLLPWLRILLGGLGAWMLARELGRGPAASILAGLVFPLSGMVSSFILFPMANAVCLAPWLLWATERLASGRAGMVPLALLAGLQLLAGHPETVVHTALLCGLYLLCRDRAWRVWAAFPVAWGIGAAIAAVQLLPLWTMLSETTRWIRPLPYEPPPLTLLLELPLRLVLPDLYGNPADGTWWGPFNFNGTAVYPGAMSLPLAAAGLAAARRDRRWLAITIVTLFSLTAAYQMPGLRDLMQSIPLVQRALHHRLLFGLDLGIALLAAAGFDRWRAGAGRWSVAGGVAVVFGLLAIAWLRFSPDFTQHGLLGWEFLWTLWVAGAATWLVVAYSVTASWRLRLSPLLLLLIPLDLSAAHGRTNPGLSMEKFYPVTGAIRFLENRPERVAGTGSALRPNAAMVYGLFDLRGDDTLKVNRYEQKYAGLATGDPTYFQPIEDWTSPWLDRLAVRWVLSGPSETPPVAGWRLAYEGPDARVFERPAAAPMVHWEHAGGGSSIRVERREPGRWQISWKTRDRDRLIVAEVWDSGWEATEAGRRLDVEPIDDLLMGVELGPGQGRLELRYRPAGFGWGLALTIMGLMVASWSVMNRFGTVS